ncbi:MAG: bifunctional lysine ketoglutarate reductase /saccharopine dehydrogenase family protein [Chloroflexi bacterium]|nr:bifunctional lysine ketoglutarate reductase /saccharopine dehydrogenase family protein [Chloroflexota bacterium]
MYNLGIRREDKNRWEVRVPLVPDDIRDLIESFGINVVVQPSGTRIYNEREYRCAGAEINEDLSDCRVVMGVKEIPPSFFLPDRTYVFFSHVIKGQEYNMPMLRRMMELGCTLIDYEKIVDEKGRRLVFFGRQAGQAGMIDSLWALGKRLEWEGYETPFSKILCAKEYKDLEEAGKSISAVGGLLKENPLPENLRPMIFGFAGYGNVSIGAQEVFDLLPFEEIKPGDVASVVKKENLPGDRLYKVVFHEEDMVEPVEPGAIFNLDEYYRHPEKYRSIFERYTPHLTVLLNGIYWEERYPRLLTKEQLKKWDEEGVHVRLRVIGDVSCDVEGSIECTLKPTDPGNPVYVYNPEDGTIKDGWEGRGVVVLAVDFLPSELPRDSSDFFSGIIKKFVPALVSADYDADFGSLNLPAELKNAVIIHRGRFTPAYEYIRQYVEK